MDTRRVMAFVPGRIIEPGRPPTLPIAVLVLGQDSSLPAVMRNRRGCDLKLETHSFQLVRREPTALSHDDFLTNDEKIERVLSFYVTAYAPPQEKKTATTLLRL
uniref:Uncharacterized protein n=1 Tax=Amphora coffeiformis TaxID=265554 RepID=A0A7S3PBW5_9STRA